MSEKGRGLGRGLNALFDDDEDIVASVTAIEDVAVPAKDPDTLGVEQMEPGMSQPRMDFDPEALQSLADSIKLHGVLQPILVRQKRDQITDEIIPDRYEIIAGERRWRAAQLAQLHEVPVVIRTLEDEQAMQIALIENLQREDLNPVEEALAYQRLIQDHEYTQAKLAESLGRSRSHIANMTRLLALPEEVLDLVRSGDLSSGHARCLIPMENPLPMAEKILAEGMSVRAVERYVQSLNQPSKEVPVNDAAPVSGTTAETQSQVQEVETVAHVKTVSKKSADLLALEDDLSAAIGMRVAFDMVPGSNTEGRMAIDFKTLGQLDHLISALKRSISPDTGGDDPVKRLLD